MNGPEFSRRDILKAVGTLTAAASLPGAADAQARRNSPERQNNLEENGLYLSIRSFEKFPGNSAILCANGQEYKGVMETIRDRDKHRSKRGRFAFNIVKRGSCVEVAGDIRDYTNGGNAETFNNRKMHVLNADDTGFATEYMKRQKDSQQGGFSMIQLRGHTGDMQPLFEMSESFQAKACFLAMGGCESTQFIKQFHKPERPVSAERNIGTTVNNTQLLIRFFDELGSGKHAAWHDFYNSIAAASSNVASGRVIVPGDPTYRDFLRKI